MMVDGRIRGVFCAAMFIMFLLSGCVKHEGSVDVQMEDFRKGMDDLKQASENLAEASTQAGKDLQQAIAAGNYASELRITQISDAITKLEKEVNDDINNQHFNIASELKNASTEIKLELAKSKKDLANLGDGAFLDLVNVVNLLPNDKMFLVRRIDGACLFHTADRKSYRVLIACNAFQVGNRYLAKFNNETLPSDAQSVTKANEMAIEIPSEFVNPLFDTANPIRASLEVDALEVDHNPDGDPKIPPFHFTTKLMLLPKRSVHYKITEQFSEIDYSGEKGWVVKTFEMPQTGSFEHEQPAMMPTIEAPAGTRFTHVSKKEVIGEKATLSDPEFFQDDTKANARCLTRQAATKTVFILSLEYQKGQEKSREVELKLTDDSDNFVDYGQYELKLSPESTSFSAEFRFFDGAVVKLGPSVMLKGGVRLTSEPSLGNNLKKLLIDIRPAFGED